MGVLREERDRQKKKKIKKNSRKCEKNVDNST
jgi:hypothetical protein